MFAHPFLRGHVSGGLLAVRHSQILAILVHVVLAYWKKLICKILTFLSDCESSCMFVALLLGHAGTRRSKLIIFFFRKRYLMKKIVYSYAIYFIPLYSPLWSQDISRWNYFWSTQDLGISYSRVVSERGMHNATQRHFQPYSVQRREQFRGMGNDRRLRPHRRHAKQHTQPHTHTSLTLSLPHALSPTLCPVSLRLLFSSTTRSTIRTHANAASGVCEVEQAIESYRTKLVNVAC